MSVLCRRTSHPSSHNCPMDNNDADYRPGMICARRPFGVRCLIGSRPTLVAVRDILLGSIICGLLAGDTFSKVDESLGRK